MYFQDWFAVRKVNYYWLINWTKFQFILFVCIIESMPLNVKFVIYLVQGMRMLAWIYLCLMSIFKYSFQIPSNEIMGLNPEHLSSLLIIFLCKNICFEASFKYLSYYSSLTNFDISIFLKRIYSRSLFDLQDLKYCSLNFIRT